MKLTKEYVEKVFLLLTEGHLDEFLSKYVDDHVQWTITGTNVLSGCYQSRQDFIDNVIVKVKNSLTGHIKMQIKNIYIDGDVAIVEMQGVATAKKGHAYNNEYIWIQRFAHGKVIEARVYYDDVLVDKTIL